MEDSTQEQKQNFLRENILEKGYDGQQFINYLKSIKGEEGEDISNWSMTDLQKVVQDFISLSLNSNSQGKQEENNQVNQINENNQDNQINENNLDNQANENNKNNQINENDQSKENNEQNNTTLNQSINPENLQGLKEEDFGIIIPDFIECRKSETTELCKYNKIEITVNDPKKVDKGFFSKTYIDFEIVTNPIKLSVRRQHAEFVWLRERLSVIFNTNVLPRLPKKGKVNGDKHIKKRMRNLERFLNYLVKDPLIKTSQILFDFLSIQDEEEYNKRKKIYDKMKTPNDFKEIKSIDGKIRVKISENKEKNIENIRDNAAFNETALKKFNQNFKILKTEMNTVINRVLSFSPLFDKLIKISSNFKEENTIIESYKQMKNLFNSWAETLKNQNSFFLNDVKEYFRLMSGNYHHMRDLAQVVENQKLNYYKLSKNLISKKLDLYKKGDTLSWQLDPKDRNEIRKFSRNKLTCYKKICFKETNNAIKNKEKYGYYLNRLISEYVRIKNINAIENKEKVKQFSKKEGLIVTEYFRKMGEIILVMDGCIIDESNQKIIEQKEEQTLEVNNEEVEDNNNINQQEENVEEQKEEGQINTENNGEDKKDEIKENENNIINDENEDNNKIEEKEGDNKNEINDKE